MWPSLPPVSPPAQLRILAGRFRTWSGTSLCVRRESFGQWLEPLLGLPLLSVAWHSMMRTHWHFSFEIYTFLLLWLSCTITELQCVELCVHKNISYLIFFPTKLITLAIQLDTWNRTFPASYPAAVRSCVCVEQDQECGTSGSLFLCSVIWCIGPACSQALPVRQACLAITCAAAACSSFQT